MKIGSLFSGYSGLDMAVEAHFGAETVWTSDIDPGASKILAHRMPHAPNHGDLTKIDWATVEPIDILTGGFPCQDLSHAGKRAGLRPGTRSGLWSHMAYAISQLRPRYVVAENVRGLLSAAAHSSVEQCAWCLGGSGDGEPDLRALGAVLGDMADLGYDARWVGLRAADIGAPHGRFRIFVIATDTRRKHVDQGRRIGPRSQEGRRPFSHDHRRGVSPAPNPGGQRHGRGEDAGALGRVDGEDAGRARERERSREVAGDRSATTPADTERERLEEGRRPCGCAEKVAGADNCQRAFSSGVTDVTDGAALTNQSARPLDYAHSVANEADPFVGFEAVRTDSIAPMVTDDAAIGAHLPGQSLGVVAVGSVSDDVHGSTLGQEIQADLTAETSQFSNTRWGDYEPAIRRWERVLGRPAPAPTETGPKGGRRLSPRFVEFMMGLPAGWVTDVPGLNRNAQLKALGNGVVPQQALEALRRTTATEVAA